MAFVTEEDKKNQPGQDQANQMPVTTASAPGAGPGTAAPGKGTAPQATPQQPFQSLQAYLTANQPQVTAQGNKMATDLNNQYGQVTGNINKATSDFGSQVNAGYAQPNADVVKSAAENPTSFVTKPENVKAFQSLYNDVYSGPESFEGTDAYGNLAKDVNKAQGDASLVGSTAGLKTYFQGQNQNATKGGNTLDSVLLQNSPEAYTSVLNAAKPYQGLMDYLGQGSASADALVPQAKQTAADTATAARNQFTGQGGVVPTFKQGVSDKYSNFINNADNDFANIRSNIANSRLSEEQMAQLGLDPAEARSFMNRMTEIPAGENIQFDPTAYLTNQIGSIRPENYASKEDYDRAIALSQLTGEDMGFLNPANAVQAGTADTTPYSFDLNKAQTDLATILGSLGTPANVPPSNSPSGNDLIGLTDEKPNDIGINDKSLVGSLISEPLGSAIQVGNLLNDNILNRSTEGLNPFGGDDDYSHKGPSTGEMTNMIGGYVNKMLPEQYQINAERFPEGSDVYNMIPPKGAVPDNLRDQVIQAVYGVFGSVPNENIERQHPGAIEEFANAIRGGIGNPEQNAWLAEYEKAHPAPKGPTSQEVQDAIDAEKAKTKAAGAPSGVYGIGGSSGVF